MKPCYTQPAGFHKLLGGTTVNKAILPLKQKSLRDPPSKFWLFTCFGVNKMDGFKMFIYCCQVFFFWQGWVDGRGIPCTSPLTSSASSGLLFGACAFLLRALEREREGDVTTLFPKSADCYIICSVNIT